MNPPSSRKTGKPLKWEVRAATPELKEKYEFIVKTFVNSIKAFNVFTTICLTGSGAKGEFTDGSDIDLAAFTSLSSRDNEGGNPIRTGEQVSLLGDVYVHLHTPSLSGLLEDFEKALALDPGSDAFRLLYDFLPVYDPEGVFQAGRARLRRKFFRSGRIRPETLSRIVEIDVEKVLSFLKAARHASENKRLVEAEEYARWGLYFLAVATFTIQERRNGGTRHFMAQLESLPWVPEGFVEAFLRLNRFVDDRESAEKALSELDPRLKGFYEGAGIDPVENPAAELRATLGRVYDAGDWKALGFGLAKMPFIVSQMWDQKNRRAARLSPGPWLVNYKGLKSAPEGPGLAETFRRTTGMEGLEPRSQGERIDEIQRFAVSLNEENGRRSAGRS